MAGVGGAGKVKPAQSSNSAVQLVVVAQDSQASGSPDEQATPHRRASTRQTHRSKVHSRPTDHSSPPGKLQAPPQSAWEKSAHRPPAGHPHPGSLDSEPMATSASLSQLHGASAVSQVPELQRPIVQWSPVSHSLSDSQHSPRGPTGAWQGARGRPCWELKACESGQDREARHGRWFPFRPLLPGLGSGCGWS